MAQRDYQRIEGLDIARFLAFVGMVIVNFDVVMVKADAPSSWLAEAMQGRAAATFVVLAGVGLGLGVPLGNWVVRYTQTVKRAAFLLAVGLINILIFDADIIHYYAFYFLIGGLFIGARSKVLWGAIGFFTVGFVACTLFLNYDTGWDWNAYHYEGFWTADGFIRNLIFNGWHPIFPWVSFLLFGLWVSSLDLMIKATSVSLVVVGVLLLTVSEIASVLMIQLVGLNSETAFLFVTDPVPPMPFFVVAGIGAACLTIGVCLLLVPLLKHFGVLFVFTSPGRQTLTLYIAHILIGMSALEELGMIGTENSLTALLAAALFCALATIYAVIWMKLFKRGPLETVLQRMVKT